MSIPIVVPAGRRLRVVLYARFSTDEQNQNSITDQFAACRRFLKKMGVTACNIDEFRDEEISGEEVHRPGIDAVREGIINKRWDLLVSEESSRLFRHPSGCMTFFEEAVDIGLRLICLNDFIDTAEDNWQKHLRDAQDNHCEANRLTRLRVGRAFEARWDNGHAVTWLRPGYRRLRVLPGNGSKGTQATRSIRRRSRF